MSVLRVLVVDDEDEFVFTLVERLELRGIEAEGVTSGSEALNKLNDKKFDVVILDVKMPGMGGIEVVRRIKTEQPDVQVILLTGHGAVEDVMEGMSAGAYDYLVKPINIDNLIQLTHAAAGGQSKKEPDSVTDESDLLCVEGLAFMGVITASLSHEINNVITIVSELAGLLDDLLRGAERGRPIKNEKLQEISEKISKHSKRGEELVKLLNRFSHSVDVTATSVNVKECLERITALCMRFAVLKKVELNNESSDELVTAHVSPFILQHAIYLCLELSLEAADKQRRITLGFSKGARGCSIVVKSADPINETDLMKKRMPLIRLLMEKLGGGVTLASPGQGWTGFTLEIGDCH